ncbi:tetratricopeptide repeat protein [Thalassotalea mangrovi]|uniref:tetratricopeptide repeat protein n=1 Tax=Thalassotalea mangrovi TaxID=2572245 RepID=UPI00145F8A90|nr:tetratricopeptide repeat protein [Thalassotalea mangrovi]
MAIDKRLHHGFLLNEVLIKPDLGIVIRDSERFHLAPKAMEVLLLLASNPANIVSYQQILSFAWGSTEASKSTISHTISEIRQVLGDPKECPVIIQTIPRKGYRLLVNPTPLSGDELSNFGAEGASPWKLSLAMLKSSRLFKVSAAYIVFSWIMLQAFAIIFPIFELPDWTLKVATLILIVGFILVIVYYWISEIDARRRLAKARSTKVTLIKQFIFDSLFVMGALGIIFLISTHLVDKIDEQVSNTPQSLQSDNVSVRTNAVAVFPFTRADESLSKDYYPVTVQEELVNHLAKSKDIDVASLRSTNLLNNNSELKLIRKQLNVKYLIEGKITETDKQIKINARLTDTDTGFQLWQSQISGSREQLLRLNQELFRKVNNALLLLITGDKASSENNVRLTESFDAYDAYLQGKAIYLNNKDLVSLRTAEQHFTRALAFDNDFALAAAALCKTNLDIYTISETMAEYQKAKESCELTASFKQTDGESHLALGKLYLTNGQYHHAVDQFEAALESDEKLSEAMFELAQTYQQLEDQQQAEKYYQLAIQTEPGYWRNYYEYGAYLFAIGDYTNAIPQLKKVVLLNQNLVNAHNALGACYMMLWQLDKAIVEFNKASEIKPNSAVFSNLATNYFWMGDFEKAAINYQKALDLTPENSTFWGNLADAIKYAGNSNKATQAYQKALYHAKQSEQINPHNISLKAQISRYYSELGDCKLAASYQVPVLNSDNKDPQVFYDLAIVAKNCLSEIQMNALLSKAVSLGYDVKVILADPQFLDYKEELTRKFNSGDVQLQGNSHGVNN